MPKRSLQINVKRHFCGVNLHSNSFKSHFEMTPWVVKMTLLRGLKWPLQVSAQKKSKWLSWRGRPGVKKKTPLKESKWLLWITSVQTISACVYNSFIQVEIQARSPQQHVLITVGLYCRDMLILVREKNQGTLKGYLWKTLKAQKINYGNSTHCATCGLVV